MQAKLALSTRQPCGVDRNRAQPGLDGGRIPQFGGVSYEARRYVLKQIFQIRPAGFVRQYDRGYPSAISFPDLIQIEARSTAATVK